VNATPGANVIKLFYSTIYERSK